MGMLYIVDTNDRGNDRAVALTGDYANDIASLANAIGSNDSEVVLWIANKAIGSMRRDASDFSVVMRLCLDTTRLIESYALRDARHMKERSALATQVCLSGLAYRLLYDALMECSTNVYVKRDELNCRINELVAFVHGVDA